MEINIEPLLDDSGWTVEAIDDDGAIEKADFTGPNAEQRARAFAGLWYGQRI